MRAVRGSRRPARRCRPCRCGGSRPGVEPGHVVVAGGQEHQVDAVAQGVAGQAGGELGGVAAPARRRQRGHPGDLARRRRPAAPMPLASDALGRATRRPRSRSSRRPPRAALLPATSSALGSATASRSAGPAGLGAASRSAADRRRPRRRLAGAAGAAKPSCATARGAARSAAKPATPGRAARIAAPGSGRSGTRAARLEHQQRREQHVQAGRAGHREQVRGGLVHPLEGLGHAQLSLPGADGSNVGGGRCVARRAGAGRSTASPRPRGRRAPGRRCSSRRRRRGAQRRRNVPAGRRRRYPRRATARDYRSPARDRTRSSRPTGQV